MSGLYFLCQLPLLSLPSLPHLLAGIKAKLTWYITSTTRIPILEPSTPHPSIFVIDSELYIAQSFWDTNAVVDS
jgi:hypothetical protein